MKKVSVVLFTLLLFSLPGKAETFSQVKDAEFGLNQASPNMMQKYQLGTRVTQRALLVAKAKYDVAVSGGSNGTRNLLGEDGKPVVLPKGAVIVDCIIDVVTAGATSGAATIALGTGQAGNDLKTATGAASYTGRVACVPVGTAATAIKLTADRTMNFTIASQPVTQGKFWVIVQYVLSE